VPELGPGDKIVKLALGLPKLSAFRDLAFTVSKMTELNQLYDEYPESPSDFREWKKKVDAILNAVRTRFR